MGPVPPTPTWVLWVSRGFATLLGRGRGHKLLEGEAGSVNNMQGTSFLPPGGPQAQTNDADDAADGSLDPAFTL